MLEPITFLLRRLLLALMLIEGPKVFLVQMVILLLTNLLVLVVTYTTDSLVSKYERRLQTLSEFTIMVTTYCFFSFNIVTVKHNFSLGYFTIGVVGFYIFICAVLIAISLV